jgi:hypothetical protein
MSLFQTKIPVDVQGIIAALPKNHFLHGVTFNKDTNEVEVLWEHDNFWSGLTIPVDFPPSDVLKQKLPKGIKKGGRPQPAAPQPKATPAPQEEIKPVAPDPNAIIGKEAFDKAIADKTPLEYQGMEAIWKPVTEGHGWTAGYYYRKAVLTRPAKCD